jgi:plastocyanin domain-containing protein
MDVLFVNLGGFALIGLIVWYFWLSKQTGTVAGITSDGSQEAFIVVKGGYSPDTIRVTAGRPVRLVFNRQESDPCSERVVLDAFGVSADLPQGSNVPVVFTPTEAGTYEFACQMGMLRGRVVAS